MNRLLQALAAIGVSLVIGGCGELREREEKEISRTDFLSGRMVTIEHDGHRFIVVVTGSSGVAIIRHPDDQD